jgi:hypothetical protein
MTKTITAIIRRGFRRQSRLVRRVQLYTQAA